jgi:hypothetical protein
LRTFAIRNPLKASDFLELLPARYRLSLLRSPSSNFFGVIAVLRSALLGTLDKAGYLQRLNRISEAIH